MNAKMRLLKHSLYLSERCHYNKIIKQIKKGFSTWSFYCQLVNLLFLIMSIYFLIWLPSALNKLIKHENNEITPHIVWGWWTSRIHTRTPNCIPSYGRIDLDILIRHNNNGSCWTYLTQDNFVELIMPNFVVIGTLFTLRLVMNYCVFQNLTVYITINYIGKYTLCLHSLRFLYILSFYKKL